MDRCRKPVPLRRPRDSFVLLIEEPELYPASPGTALPLPAVPPFHGYRLSGDVLDDINSEAISVVDCRVIELVPDFEGATNR